MGEAELVHVLAKGGTVLRFKRKSSDEVVYQDTVMLTKVDASLGAGRLDLEDRVAFVLGVLVLLLLQFLLLRHPALLPLAYTAILSSLLALRVPLFLRQKEGLFLIDFCYFVNLSTIVQIFFFPDNLSWFNANYVLCLGCLMNAIVVWQNCLMLHSLDRLTSLLLHALAPLTLHTLRWAPAHQAAATLNLWDAAILPITLYLAWQVAYLLVVEVVLAPWLRTNLDQSFSLRHLASDTSAPVNQLVTGLLRGWGVMAQDEVFDASTWKTKLTMVGAQLVYTLLTLLPVPLLYSSYTASTIYLCSIYLMVLWRGASDYMADWAARRGVTLIKEVGEVDKELICNQLGPKHKTA